MASGDRPILAVEERPERGSRATRRLRREGYVPGVVYGGGDGDCTPFKVGVRDLRAALIAGSAVLDLTIGGGTSVPVIVKDQQHHPVRDNVMHLDLLRVRLDEKIQSTVSVELEGVEEAPGVKEGGVVEHVTRELNIEALPGDIPERVLVDVSGLEAAATMHLAEVTAPPGVEFLDDPEETVIATVTIPTEVVEPEVEEETELVGEEGEVVEGEEAAEGEAPPEAEAAAEGEAPAEPGQGGGGES
jgi:large subunit ribosomal protein L25